jgi:adenosylcobinamide kinase/adenosylcobinamide-phosphate guanylyltransferase
MLIFITGGARSGKSAFAERYAAKLGQQGIYIATAQLYDDEMRERARVHREDRERSGFAWVTCEEPYALADRIVDYGREGAIAADSRTSLTPPLPPPPVLLVDCLTLWLSNWLLKLEAEGRLTELALKIDELVEVCAVCPLPLLTVSNEVGGGIVPEYPLGRLFRDYAGILNRKMAAASTQALLLTAGVPLDLKKLAFSLEEDHL